MATSITIEETVEIERKVECNNCSTDIEVDQQGDSLIITPCPTCLNEKYAEGLADGKELPF